MKGIPMKSSALSLAVIATLGFSPAWAQSGHEGHDMATMDHGGMDMQGGKAPADARDPHEYANGATLESGPYARPGPRELKLADEHSFASLLVDRLEHARVRNGGTETAYEAQAWFGRDYDKLVVKAEGEHARGKLQEARTELLWSHAVASYWDTQVGLRQDSGVGPDRSWLGIGVQGLAPYWFEVDATAYLGNNGRTALRLGAEYELLLSQRLILQPRAEINAYGKNDLARDIGSGLSDGVFGVRLRYEFSRQFAPYVGVERVQKYGNTADIARAAGEPTGETRWVAGLRFWF
jgi:copper resistance protein B